MLFSHRHLPWRRSMSKNLKKDQVERSRKQLHRRKQRRPMLRLFFIWMERLHRGQSRMRQLWYGFHMRCTINGNHSLYSLSSTCTMLRNGLKSITISASGAFTISSLTSSSLIVMAVINALMPFWSSGISGSSFFVGFEFIFLMLFL